MSLSTELMPWRSRMRRHNDRAFAAWAQSYDSQLNPLLMLEERYLKRMFPKIQGRDVLDAGCGSGRWLAYLAEKRPRSLRGIDASDEMIEVASRKCVPGVELFHGPCESTPFADKSVDLIVSSFVLGYIKECDRVALEIDRIARDGCDLIFSDMHPATQRQLGWKRAFEGVQGEIVLDTVTHDLGEIVETFLWLGWQLCASIEPEFGAPERGVFVAAGRLNRFVEAEGNPAIYMLHLQKRKSSVQHEAKRDVGTFIHGGSCALGATENTAASVRISNGKISQIASNPAAYRAIELGDVEIDLTGYLLMPGLINAHDHLEFALFPRMGHPPYNNASEWAADIHATYADAIATHRLVPRDVRLWWGGLRNLLCGVTTVCHHNPPEPELQDENFPVRVVQEYGWEHSLAFGHDLCAARADTPDGRPFIVHACEGVDEESRAELRKLDQLGILDRSTVIVHGLAIDDEGAALMRQRGASLVICPSSNHFLFGQTLDGNFLTGIRAVALGSDSPLTAAGDLLDEIRFAARHRVVSSPHLYEMATDSAAKVLRLGNGAGTLRVGGVGDLIAIRDRHRQPADAILRLTAKDVELAMIGGRVQLASATIFNRLPLPAKKGMEPLWVDGTLRWLRAPVATLLRKAEELLGVGMVRLGGLPVRVPDWEEVGDAC